MIRNADHMPNVIRLTETSKTKLQAHVWFRLVISAQTPTNAGAAFVRRVCAYILTECHATVMGQCVLQEFVVWQLLIVRLFQTGEIAWALHSASQVLLVLEELAALYQMERYQE